MKLYYVYVMASITKSIYVGVTNNLERRVYEHKHKLISGFTKRYNVQKLVYFETSDDIGAAITREKEIKKWRREKKIKLIKSINPNWTDLSVEWY